VKNFLTFLLLIVCLSPLAVAQTTNDTAEQTALNAAAELYFSYRPAEALQAYLDLSKKTQNRDAFLNAIFIAMEQNNTQLAVDTAAAAYRAYPHDRTVMEMLAEVFLADGQYTAAEALLSQLPEKDGRSELLHINLARAQLGLNETKLAKYNLRMAANGKSHTALSNFLLGQIYAQEKNFKKAASHFQIASTYDHQFLEAKKQYANALEQIGNYNEAYRQYKMIHSTDKISPEVPKAIERLRPKLTRAEHEITAGKKPSGHTLVRPVTTLDGTPLQEIKVGLGMRSNGKPSPRTSVVFTPSHDFTVADKNGKIIQNGKAKETWKVALENKRLYIYPPKGPRKAVSAPLTVTPVSTVDGEGTTIIVQKLMSGAGMTWASLDDKEYRGKLQILYNAKLATLVPVNIVNIEEYLQGVIASEMPTGFPMDALRSQAVLARTYILKHLGKHRAHGYDVCDTQNCQVYGGVSAESERGNAAVESTMGEILTYQEKPIESVFSANCGGITQSAKEAGWTDTPYLQPVSDYKDFDFSHLQPYHFKELLQYQHDAYSRYDKNVSMAAFRWIRVVPEAELREVIKRQKRDIGQITAIMPLKRGKSGYVSRLLVKGTKGSVTLNKENVIRNNLSIGMLRSSYFIVEPNYENRRLKQFVFYGGGWGHGVGFCQTGAAGRASAGQDYKTILKHYFPLADFIKNF